MVAASGSDPRILPQTSSASGSHSLPVEFVNATAQRLIVFMYVVAAANAFYSVLYLTVWREYGLFIGRVVAVVQIVGSLVLARYLRRGGERSRSVVVAISVAYEMAICLSLGLIEFIATPAPMFHPENRISWVCVIIVLFPVLLPAPPRMTGVVSFTAALTTPLVYAITLAVTGRKAAPPIVLSSLFVPQFVCAAMAFFLGTVIHRLGTMVGRARRLGSYELVDKLGAGGMGEVWRARHRLLVRPAAIKLIRPQTLGAGDDLSGRELRERFEREAQATSLLTSPHTVELYDFGVSSDGVFYYVMELLDGIDLDSLVRDHGPIPPERAVWLLRQICDSLDDAHRAGLVHRDIKPANIVASRRGRHHDYVKVLDFGLVKGSPAGAPEVQLTGDTKIKGTPAFLAPEAATGAAGIDARSDIYSLGCVAYWLLTGAFLFDAATPVGMAIAHVTQKPKPASERAQLPIPAELDALILQCLEKNPAARPPSALALQKLLDAVPFAESWSEERAASWWLEHLPAPVARSTLSRSSVPRTPTVFYPAER